LTTDHQTTDGFPRKNDAITTAGAQSVFFTIAAGPATYLSIDAPRPMRDNAQAGRHRMRVMKKFSVEKADAGEVAEQVGALRAAVAAAERNPVAAAREAPRALGRLLEIIENINLRLAELEADL
jgi:hypothetical protein